MAKCEGCGVDHAEIEREIEERLGRGEDVDWGNGFVLSYKPGEDAPYRVWCSPAHRCEGHFHTFASVSAFLSLIIRSAMAAQMADGLVKRLRVVLQPDEVIPPFDNDAARN